MTKLQRALERAASFRYSKNHGDILNDTEADLLTLAKEVLRLRRRDADKP